MPTRQVAVEQFDFSGGEVTADAPHLIAPDAVESCVNGLYLLDGRVRKRGGCKMVAPLLTEPNGRVNLCENPRGLGSPGGWLAQPGSAGYGTFLSAFPHSVPGIESGFRCYESGAPFSALVSIAFSATEGQMYQVSLWAYCAGGGDAWIADSGDSLGSYNTRFTAESVSFGFSPISRVSFEWEAPSTGTYFLCVGTGMATELAWTGVMIEPVDEPGPVGEFFDGDSLNGTWSGTPYQSYSQELGPASDKLSWIASGVLAGGESVIAATPERFVVMDGDELIDIGGDGLTRPVSHAIIEGMMFIGGGYIYAGAKNPAPYSAGTVSVSNGSKTVTGVGTSWEANVGPGMLLKVSGRVYPVASVNSDTSLTLRDEYEGSTASGVSYVLTPIYEIQPGDPYPAARHYATVANRLVCLVDDEFRFSQIERPHVFYFTANNTQVPNRHKVGDGGSALGVASIGGVALAFTTKGVWTIEGLAYDIVDDEGDPNHRVQTLSREMILWGETGIASWEQMLVVPCLDGVYLMDGISSPVRISRSIDPSFTADARRYYAGGGVVYRNHYILPVIDSNAQTKRLRLCRLDPAVHDRRRRTSFAWSRFEGIAGGACALTQAEQPRRLLAASPVGVTDHGVCFDPGPGNTLDLDTASFTFDLTTRTFLAPSGTMVRWRWLRLHRELKNGVIDVSYNVGDTEAVSSTRWNLFKWNLAKWAGGRSETVFRALAGLAGPGAVTPHKFRIDRRARQIRFRIRCSSATSVCILNGIEVFLVPSRAVRQ